MGPIATARAPPYLGFFNDFSLTHRILSLIILVTGRACACGRPGFARFAPIQPQRAGAFLPPLLPFYCCRPNCFCSVLARPSSQSVPLASSLVVSCLPPLSNHSTPATPMKELQRVCFLSFFSRYETCMRKSKETYQGGEHKGYIVMLHK